MKTLVVLSALASLAFAAPSFSEKNWRRDVWPENRRDKKSPQGYFYVESTPAHLAGPPIHVNSEIDNSASSSSARSFGLKKHVFKPTIIKHHNNGYQIYRNSEEERAQADSLEDCSKQVKVKLCDRHNKESKAFTRSVKDNSNVQDDNMESRIKQAKEAIEDIQRELKNREQSPKSVGWNQRENESDAEIHKDIESARKVLDHIHRNFDKLESMSLRVEPSHQVHDDTVKSNDMKKLAKWSEHTETSKRNAEDGRDMKDILQAADHQSNSEALDTTQLHNVPAKEATEILKERAVINKDKHNNDDMSVAATSLDDKMVKLEQKHEEAQNLEARNSEPTLIKTAEHHENSDKKALEPIESINNVDSSKMKVADNLEMKTGEMKKSLLETKSLENPAGLSEKKADLMEEKLAANSETSMKSAEHEKDLKKMHDESKLALPSNQNQQLADNIDISHMRAPAVNTENMDTKPDAKDVLEFHKLHSMGMHTNNMHHGNVAAASSNHMNTHGHVSRGHTTHIHENTMHHAKSADMDGFQTKLQMNLGDFSEKSAMEWLQKQDSARSAYGPYGAYGAGGYGSGSYGGGSGAVGVFPSAHVGGCAVPLLLSCSPSVVSGTLAKSGYGHAPGYGSAPAYKATEDIKERNSHNKRDIKKTDEISKEKTTHKTTKAKTILTQKI